MLTRLHPHILALLFLLAFVPSAQAQQDSAGVSSLLIRRWYVSPDRESFYTRPYGPLLQGWSLVGFWNPQLPLSPQKEGRHIPPFSFSGGLQKDFDKSNALRLTFGYSRTDYPGVETDQISSRSNRYQFSLDYLWNLSNHWYGYDPSRSWEWLLMAGGSYGWTTDRLAPTRRFWQAEMGLQLRKTLSPRLSAMVEPYYYISDNDYDLYDTQANFDDAIGIKAGFIYRLTPSLRTTSLPSLSEATGFQNWYVQTLFGVSVHSDLKFHWRDVRKSTYNIAASLGHWVSPAYGFRFGASDRQWFNYETIVREPHFRVEGMLNVPTLWDEISVRRLGFELSAGVELGVIREYDRQRHSKVSDEFYRALTGALQTHYYINDHFALVGEARYAVHRDRDCVFIPSLGFEYYHSTYARYSPWRRGAGERSWSGFSFLHDLNWFAEFGAGALKESNQIFENKSTAMFEAAAGVRFNAYSSLRLKERLAYRSIHEFGTSKIDSHLGLDYMLDFTTCLLGVNPQRRFTLRPFVGPAWSVDWVSPIAETDSHHHFAIDYGLQHVIRLNSGLDLYGELYHLMQFGHNRNDRWGLSAGLAYTFDHDQLTHPFSRSSVTSGDSRYYTQVLGGAQLAAGFGFYNNGSGGLVDLTVGRTVSSMMALQATLFNQTLSYGHKPDNVRGARVEVVADMLSMLWADSHEQGWAVTAQVGAELARYRRLKFTSYPTVATQVRRRIGNSPAWAVLQGRLQTATTSKNFTSFWTLGAGLHYEVPRDGSFAMKSHNPIFLQAGLSWYDADKLGYSLAAGVDINRVHGIRLSYEYAATSKLTSQGQKVRRHTFGLDYLYDVIPVAMGSAAGEQRLGIRPFLGLQMDAHNYSFEDPKVSVFGSFDGGLQVDYRLTDHVSLFLEQKAIYSPFDDYLSPSGHEYWHINTTGGVKFVL